jgi:hypothetical protein
MGSYIKAKRGGSKTIQITSIVLHCVVCTCGTTTLTYELLDETNHFGQVRWCQLFVISKSKGPHGEIQGMFVATNHKLATYPSTLMFIGSSIGLMQLSQLIVTF